ncbi:CAP domain-containing protein [Patescibacteria group bacterium]|nr:CAP domain-containing protein [Patescibacteria group bacterium]
MGLKNWFSFVFMSIFIPNSLKTMEWKMLRLLNRDRRKYRIQALFMQDDLRRVAREHSKDMAKLDYFEHKNWRGQTHVDRLMEAKVTDTVSGENLAKIGGYNYPVHRAEIGLMNSPGHRANILNKQFNCVGIGIHKSENKIFYFTQNFALRKLIFLKKPKESINIQKGLFLYFKPVGKVQMGVYRLLDASGVIKEKGFPIEKGKNMLNIHFPDIGHYKIEIFSGEKGKIQLNLSNQFSVHVKKGWFL